MKKHNFREIGGCVGRDWRFGIRELFLRIGTDLYGDARKPKAWREHGSAFSYIPELPDMRECHFAGPERDVVIREETIELRVDGN